MYLKILKFDLTNPFEVWIVWICNFWKTNKQTQNPVLDKKKKTDLDFSPPPNLTLLLDVLLQVCKKYVR